MKLQEGGMRESAVHHHLICESLPWKDEHDIECLQQERTVVSRGIHNKVTKKLTRIIRESEEI